MYVLGAFVFYRKVMEYMKSIVIIGTYYGKLTDFMSLFLKTVELNPTVDFLIMTDIDCEDIVPPNVRLVKYTFEELVAYIQGKYKFKLGNIDYYSICKFRPAFGDIFEEYISNYDYWGYCDYDILLGNIRHFFTDDLLEQYDKFLSHGHFTLFRNNNEMKTLYKEKARGVVDYKQVFSSDLLIGHFEEYPYGISRLAKEKKVLIYEAPIFADLDPFFYSFRKLFSYYTICDDDSENIKQYFMWSDGTLYDCILDGKAVQKEECLYVHFHKRKMDIHLRNINETWYIYPNVITNNKPNIDLIYISNKEEIEYCNKKVRELQPSRVPPIIKLKNVFHISRWKRKWFFLKAKRLYKVSEYQFIRGGFK